MGGSNLIGEEDVGDNGMGGVWMDQSEKGRSFNGMGVFDWVV